MNIVILLIVLLASIPVIWLSGDRLASKIAMLFSMLSVILSGFLLSAYLQGVNPDYSVQWLYHPSVVISFKVDGLGLAMLLMTTVLMTIIIGSKFTHPGKKEREFYALIMLSLFSIVGVFTSSNGLIYYVFWELSLIPVYFIILYWGNGEEDKRRRTTFTFFIYTIVGSLCMLIAFIYLYSKTGSFELEALYRAELSSQEQLWIFLAFFLAFAIKIPLFPFHTWQADIYQRAPAVGTMILSALMSKMGLYSIMRWQLPIAPEATHQLQPVLVILCIVTVIYGTVIAQRQENLKRLFAFASLAHVGFIAGGIYALTFNGLNGAILLIIAHGCGIIGLFFAAEVIYRRLGTPLISRMGGIRSLASRFSFLFLIMILSSIGIPLMFNFIGEFTIMYGVYQVNGWYGVLLGTSMFLSAFLMLRTFQHVMLGEPSKSFRDLTMSEFLVFFALSLILLFFGVYSTPITDLITPVLNQILLLVG